MAASPTGDSPTAKPANKVNSIRTKEKPARIQMPAFRDFISVYLHLHYDIKSAEYDSGAQQEGTYSRV
jgi:hypothetical protein